VNRLTAAFCKADSGFDKLLPINVSSRHPISNWRNCVVNSVPSMPQFDRVTARKHFNCIAQPQQVSSSTHEARGPSGIASIVKLWRKWKHSLKNID
jgi:hypothetical protein